MIGAAAGSVSRWAVSVGYTCNLELYMADDGMRATEAEAHPVLTFCMVYTLGKIMNTRMHRDMHRDMHEMKDIARG